LRALRYLTGQEFKASTTLPLAQPVDEFLGSSETFLFGSNHPADLKALIPFAREWPSRGCVYLAPKDAQATIIQQWQDWFSEHGATFKPALLDRDEVDWVH
jgi:hypothetical protein